MRKVHASSDFESKMQLFDLEHRKAAFKKSNVPADLVFLLQSVTRGQGRAWNLGLVPLLNPGP